MKENAEVQIQKENKEELKDGEAMKPVVAKINAKEIIQATIEIAHTCVLTLKPYDNLVEKLKNLTVKNIKNKTKIESSK